LSAIWADIGQACGSRAARQLALTDRPGHGRDDHVRDTLASKR
jgi:hypothetical protein